MDLKASVRHMGNAFLNGVETCQEEKSEGFSLCCVMINLLQYYCTTGHKFCKQTNCHNVNTNNASLGLMENVIVTNFGAKYGRKIGTNIDVGEGKANQGGLYLPGKITSPIYYHANTTSHSIQLDSFSIVDRESQVNTRTIKEVMFIRGNGPPFNRNLGKYHLPHIWDEVLQDMPALCLQWYPPFPHHHHSPTWAMPTRGYMHITLVSMVLWGVPPTSHIHIGTNFPAIFWDQNWKV